jgi:hypothetical protein
MKDMVDQIKQELKRKVGFLIGKRDGLWGTWKMVGMELFTY